MLKHLTLFCLLTLLGCRENEHFVIEVKNNATEAVIVATKQQGMGNNCILVGDSLGAGETYKYRPFNFSIERSLTANDIVEIYIVSVGGLNPSDQLYPCDSIASRNDILKQYSLNLQQLEANDYRIIYP